LISCLGMVVCFGSLVPVGRVFPFVLVFQLCLGVLELLDFFGVFDAYMDVVGRFIHVT